MNVSAYVTPSQPSLKGSKIPDGHVILNSKYHSSDISKALADAGLNIQYDDSIGLIDCYPTCKCAVIIAQANQIINQTEISRKIKKLSKFTHHKIMLIEVGETSDQYFTELQNDLMSTDIKLLPFTCIKDVALIINQFNYLESHSNPFLNKSKNKKLIEQSILSFVQSFPGLGEKKALELLKKYKSVKSIGEAPLEDIAQVVGKNNAILLKQHMQ